MANNRPLRLSVFGVAFTVGVVALATGQPNVVVDEKQVKAELFVLIPIVEREHGYKYFESQVLASRKELKEFLDTVAKQKHWNRKTEFLSAMEQAEVDFEKSSIVLARSTAGSGSYKVGLIRPKVRDGELLFRFKWDKPPLLTADMAYYCYAVIVPKGIAKNIRVISPYRDDVVLPLSR